ncbi:MAG: hypothetical protein UZ03_NOB001002762 [Nitrospira sp. OLB3]|nr:MAG: hypothetical protein UZ03_NOB001002762 [Nitrospira sp. OLB3]
MSTMPVWFSISRFIFRYTSGTETKDIRTSFPISNHAYCFINNVRRAFADLAFELCYSFARVQANVEGKECMPVEQLSQ